MTFLTEVLLSHILCDYALFHVRNDASFCSRCIWYVSEGIWVVRTEKYLCRSISISMCIQFRCSSHVEVVHSWSISPVILIRDLYLYITGFSCTWNRVLWACTSWYYSKLFSSTSISTWWIFDTFQGKHIFVWLFADIRGVCL